MIPPIVVFTSDKYIHALRGFSFLFNRFWVENPSVIVAGFTPPTFPLPRNFSFHSIGKFDDYPVSRWSDAVLDFFDQFPSFKQCILMLEDYWLIRRVNHYAIEALSHYMEEHPEVIKMDLCAERLYALGAQDYAVFDCFDLIASDPDSPYHMSLYPGIWNIAALRRVLVRGETPWQVELDGTPRLASLRKDFKVIGTRQYPMRIALALRNGRGDIYQTEGIPPATLTELRMRGYLNND